MADQKISQLNELFNPTSGDTLPIVNGGETKKITVHSLLSGSNVQPYFISTDTSSVQNYKVGDNVWLGDVGEANTLVVNGVQNSGSAFVMFGYGTGHIHPYIGHIADEDANVLSVVADTTKISNAVIIGSGSLVAGDPEMLHIYSSGSFNIAYLKGNTDNYSQINVQNTNSSSGASSDIVATADNGTEEIHYVNMGINSSGFMNEFSLGYQNDAYVYNAGRDLYIGTMDAADINHGHVHLFTSNSWENPQISILNNQQVGFNTSGVTEGFMYEFSGSAKFNNDVKVDGYIQGSGSVFLQPDTNDSRYLEIYNTAPADIHIRGNASLTYFGDDTNYVMIDSINEKITINTTSGTTINNLLKLSPVDNLPMGSSLGDMVVSGSNLYFHNGIGWNSINMTSI